MTALLEEFAVGAETYQSQRRIVWFFVDQVGFEVALSMLGVLPGQGVIAVFVGKDLIGGEQGKNREKIDIQGRSVLSLGFALVVFFELAGLASRPHGDRPSGLQSTQSW